MEVHYEAGNVLDNAADWGYVSFAVLQRDANLRAGDVEPPQAFAMALNEARHSGHNVFVGGSKVVGEVHENMVAV